MLFNSHPFLFAFLPIVVIGFVAVARWRSPRATMLFLIAASLLFYAWWDWRYVFLLLVSIGFNYGWGALLRKRVAAAPRPRRVLLGLGVAVNLGLLGYFKYASFFAETFATALGLHWDIRRVVLPLAISFFTFEQITYLVDAYRGGSSPHDFLHYGTFITFFPRLIAGPIVRPAQILPQLRRASTFDVNAANLSEGLFIFAFGLAEKVLLADTFAPWVAPIFDRAPLVPFFDAWGATLAFALQLYFDFAGYSDMAIGLALMFNIELPENFDVPYQARSVIEFWRRWHMTLSNFLRDYLYIPLGGNCRGRLRRFVNVFITMLLGGLWHGASWTFVAWGGLHGVYVTVNHLWRRSGIRLPDTIAWAVTCVAVLIGWVFFRAPSFGRAQRAGWNARIERVRLEHPAVLHRPPRVEAFVAGAGFRAVGPQSARAIADALAERLCLRRCVRAAGRAEHLTHQRPSAVRLFSILRVARAWSRAAVCS